MLCSSKLSYRISWWTDSACGSWLADPYSKCGPGANSRSII